MDSGRCRRGSRRTWRMVDLQDRSVDVARYLAYVSAGKHFSDAASPQWLYCALSRSVDTYTLHMIRDRFFLQLNSLMFHADRGPHRVALGLVAAWLLINPSLSALPFGLLWVVVVLLLPRRST